MNQLKTHSYYIDIHNDKYVLTPDNYFKMNLIYLRVKSRLPIIIMGEAGCGKKSLVKFLCRKVLNERVEIFNINAGITKN